jgi:hypothetical protein
MSYQRAYQLADQLARRHRFQVQEQRQPGLVQSVALLYNIGLERGLPVHYITSAILGSGYVISKAAIKLGTGVYEAFISQSATQETSKMPKRIPDDEPENSPLKRMRGSLERGGIIDTSNQARGADPRGHPVSAGTSGDVEPASNLMTASRTGRTDGSETAPDPVNNEQIKPYQYETVNAICPYYDLQRSWTSLAIGTGSASVNGVTFRLNTLYDIKSVSTYASDPTPAADVTDGTTPMAMFYKYWIKLYRYYTVTKTTYEMKMWTDTRSDVDEIAIWTYHHGQQQPPLVDESATPQVVNEINRRLHPHCHRKVLTPRTVTEDRNQFSTTVTIEGEYFPGNRTVHNDVAEDEFHETWHKEDEVPSLRECVTFIAQRTDKTRTGASSVLININYEFTMKIHAQFKDQKVVLQYPTQTSDIPAFTDVYNVLQA